LVAKSKELEMSKILFWPDVYLEQGHWLPAISIAQELNNSGHTVEFMGIADCEQLVINHQKNGPADADTVPLVYHTVFEEEYPAGYTRSNQHKSVSERWKPKHLLPMMNGALDSIMSTGQYDLVICGYFASLEALLVHYKYEVKIMTLTTYLRHPQDDPAIRVSQNLIGLSEPVYAQFMTDVLALNPSSTNTDLITDFDEFAEPLLKAPEIVPCPIEFEFNHYKPDLGEIDATGNLVTENGNLAGRVFYTEPCIKRALRSDLPPAEFSVSSIPAGKKLIFATSGSQVQDYEKKARNMFQKLIGMMSSSGLGEYHLLLGVGSSLIKEDWAFEDLPANVTVESWVNQTEAMERASVVFIHGGLATIKEALYYEKPIVILPHGKDQLDNALRIRQNSLGEIGYVEALSYDGLRDLMLKAINNYQQNSNRAKMATIFNEAEEPVSPEVRQSIKVINAYLNY